MKENLKDYILHLDNWIPKNIIDKSISELSDNKTWQRHTYSNSKTFVKKSKNKDKELDICLGDNLTYLKEIHDLTWKALEKYIVIDKISGDTFKGWKGFSKIRFNRYKKGQIMSRHSDHIVSLFQGEQRGIPVLSIVCVLNEDYEGGEFIVDNEIGEIPYKLRAGQVLFFPIIYAHTVAPVKKGVRKAIIGWLSTNVSYEQTYILRNLYDVNMHFVKQNNNGMSVKSTLAQNYLKKLWGK